MADIRINISNLSDGSHEYSFNTMPADIGLDERFKKMVEVQVVVDKSSDQFLVHAKMETEAEFECDRCLERSIVPVNAAYRMVYAPDDRSMEQLQENEDIQLLPQGTNYIELDDDVRQFVLLAVPQKMLCKEDCLGICPVCGANKNAEQCSCIEVSTDSPWDALKKLSHN